jgi:hypothetical protein
MPFMDRLPGKLMPITFGQWCDAHKVTDEEYEKLLTYWLALRLQKCGVLNILLMGR